MISYCLLLETVLYKTFISLIKGKEIIDTKFNILDFKTDNTFVKDISELLNKNSLTPDNINEIYIVNGPGYFTGIRAGITITKAFMISLNIKVNPVDSFNFLNGCISNTDDKVIIISASKRDFYAGFFENNLLIRNEILEIEDIIKLKKKVNIYTESMNISDCYDFDYIEPIPHLNFEYKQINSPSELKPNYLRQESDMFKVQK